MIRHDVRHDKELHHTRIKGALEGRKPPGRPRNSYIFQLKKEAEINIHAG